MITGTGPEDVSGRKTLTRSFVPSRTVTGTSQSTWIPFGSGVTRTSGRIALRRNRQALLPGLPSFRFAKCSLRKASDLCYLAGGSRLELKSSRYGEPALFLHGVNDSDERESMGSDNALHATRPMLLHGARGAASSTLRDLETDLPAARRGDEMRASNYLACWLAAKKSRRLPRRCRQRV